MFKPTRASPRAARGLIRAFGYLPAKRAFAVDNPELDILTVQRPPDELFCVSARRCQERYRVAGIGVLDVVARSAMVPKQPALALAIAAAALTSWVEYGLSRTSDVSATWCKVRLRTFGSL